MRIFKKRLVLLVKDSVFLQIMGALLSLLFIIILSPYAYFPYAYYGQVDRVLREDLMGEKIGGIMVVDKSSDKGAWDSLLLKELEYAITVLPDEILNTFYTGDPALKIIIVNSLDEVEGISDNTKESVAFYHEEINQIFVTDKKTGYRYFYIFLHEFGHAYHYLAFDYNELGFEAIRERERTPSDNARKNYVEDFAETFFYYFALGDILERKAPLRYEKMKELLRQANIKR